MLEPDLSAAEPTDHELRLRNTLFEILKVIGEEVPPAEQSSRLVAAAGMGRAAIALFQYEFPDLPADDLGWLDNRDAR